MKGGIAMLGKRTALPTLFAVGNFVGSVHACRQLCRAARARNARVVTDDMSPELVLLASDALSAAPTRRRGVMEVARLTGLRL
jgi:hypothetical protein